MPSSPSSYFCPWFPVLVNFPQPSLQSLLSLVLVLPPRRSSTITIDSLTVVSMERCVLSTFLRSSSLKRKRNFRKSLILPTSITEFEWTDGQSRLSGLWQSLYQRQPCSFCSFRCRSWFLIAYLSEHTHSIPFTLVDDEVWVRGDKRPDGSARKIKASEAVGLWEMLGVSLQDSITLLVGSWTCREHSRCRMMVWTQAAQSACWTWLSFFFFFIAPLFFFFF